MKLIGITKDVFFQDESNSISISLANGLDILHIRKPFATEKELKSLLDSIPVEFYSKIVLHDFHNLAAQYPVKGIHLNRRNPFYPPHFKGSISRSCHQIDELYCINQYDYLFLSPLFDSISKSGYQSNFTEQQLCDASAKRIINENVIALGGIHTGNISLLRAYGFGGAAVLGTLWENTDEQALIARIACLKLQLNKPTQSPCYNS